MTLNEFIKAKADRYTSTTIEYNGYTFKAGYGSSFPKEKDYTIWNKTGGTVVYSWAGDLPITVEKLETLMQYTIDGVPFCNRCLEKIEGDYHTYFAGRYCDKCWTPQDQKNKDWDYSHLD